MRIVVLVPDKSLRVLQRALGARDVIARAVDVGSLVGGISRNVDAVVIDPSILTEAEWQRAHHSWYSGNRNRVEVCGGGREIQRLADRTQSACHEHAVRKHRAAWFTDGRAVGTRRFTERAESVGHRRGQRARSGCAPRSRQRACAGEGGSAIALGLTAFVFGLAEHTTGIASDNSGSLVSREWAGAADARMPDARVTIRECQTVRGLRPPNLTLP